jgi:dTDP-4-amino-4,6-dideoxygalactose transaminase
MFSIVIGLEKERLLMNSRVNLLLVFTTILVDFYLLHSCTEAIYLSARLFEFSQGDEVIVPAISFPSIGSAILEAGARIVFCDVDPYSLNVRVEDIRSVAT